MNLIFNFPEDSGEVENKIAYIRASLMQRYIDNLEVSEVEKNNIKECLIKKLQKT